MSKKMAEKMPTLINGTLGKLAFLLYKCGLKLGRLTDKKSQRLCV